MKLFAERSLWPFTVAVAVGVACSPMIQSSDAAFAASAPAVEAASQEQEDVQRGREALETAREHAEAGRWQRAAEAYSEALRHVPDDPEAREGLQRALSMLDRGDTIDQVEAERERQRQRAIIEFDDAYDQAQEALAEGEYSDAERTMVTARVRLNRAREFLREAEFADRDQRAEALLAQVEEARIVEQLRREEERRREAERQRREEEDRVRRERERQIQENLRRVRQLQQELRYDEALQVIEEILFIDELNPAALALRDVMRTSELYRDYSEIQQEKERGYARMTIEGQRAMIPPRVNIDGPGRRSISGIMEYPEDWPQLSLQRTFEGEGFHESPANRAVLQRMSEARIPIDFRNNTFEEVVNYMTQVSGLNIYVDWRALEMIGVYRDSEVNLQLGDLPVSTALDRVLDQLGDDFDRPSYTVQDGMLMVSSDDALRRQTTTIVYDIRDLLFEPQSMGNAPSFNLNQAQRIAQNNPINNDGVFDRGNQYVASVRGGGRSEPPAGGGAGGGLFGDPQAESPTTRREDRIRQLISIIQETIDPEGWRDLGGDTGSIQELNGNLIITNTPRNHRQITGLLSQLREIRALQISVEVKLLNVSTDWFEQIGVDLDLYFNTNNDMFRQARASDPNFQLSDFFGADGQLRDSVVFGSPAQVLSDDIPANVVPTGSFIGVPSGEFTNGFEDTQYFVGPVGTPVRNRRGFSPIGVTQDTLGLAGTLANLPTSFSQAAAASPAIAVGMQFLDDVQVDLLIEATQADRRSVIMSAPRVTFFNDTFGWLQIVQETSIVASVFPIVQEGGVAFQPNIVPIPDGFTMLLHGVVSSDKRYVSLNVQFQSTEFLDFDTAQVTGQARGGSGIVDDGPAGQVLGQSITLPETSTQNVFSSVSVPDKGTVMLGGWRNVREIEVETGVPVLSKIPFVNRFFTNRLTSKDEESLLILVRPEIIIQHEHEDTLFPGLSDQIGAGSGSYLR